MQAVALLNALVEFALLRAGLVRTNSYATSFCGQPHRLADGVPWRHECVVVPPEALVAEARGDFDLAVHHLERAEPLRRSPGAR